MNNANVVLGCFLLDNSLLDEAIASGAKSEMFGATASIFDLMVKVRGDGREFDASSLSVEGAQFKELSELMDYAPTTLGFKAALGGLIWDWKKRQVIAQSKDLQSFLSKSKPEDQEHASSLLSDIQQLLLDKEDSGESIDDVIGIILSDLDAELSGSPKSCIELRWGIPDADRYMLPIQQHELVVIGARPSTGKSSIAVHLTLQALKDKRRVALFSLETSIKAVLCQIAGQHAGVNLRALKSEEKPAIEVYRKSLRRLAESDGLRVFDRCLTIDAIEAQCRLLIQSWKPEAIIIDYLNLIRVPGNKEKLYEKTTEVSQRMIALRKTVNCPIILLAQLNRASVNDHRQPEPHDFRDSGSIEQDAHRIVFIHRPSEGFNGQDQFTDSDMPPAVWDTLLLQKKNRDGPLAAVKCKFEAATTRFYGLTQERF